MASIPGTVSAVEQSLRSVFVGNIAYDVTEEQLKDIFSEVGPVVSLRLVHDRDTGKPKGYAFCEYKDQETALSAMRNLNSFDMNGHPLRVDSAASEKYKEELKYLQTSLIEHGTSGETERAPEAISKAVASLPPEQMFELMKQMKVCIQNNPNEARNMLLQNPQLAYALLQAQVIMRIVEPQVALGLLHRQTPNPNSNIQQDEPVEPPQNQSFPTANPPVSIPSEIYDPGQVFRTTQAPMPVPPPSIHPAAPTRSLLGDLPTLGSENRTQPAPAPQILSRVHIPGFQERGPNQFGREGFDPMGSEPMGDRDMRMLGDRDMRQTPMPPLGPPMGDRDMRQVPMVDQDLRHLPPSAPQPPLDPRFRGMAMAGQGGPFGNVPRQSFSDPRSGAFERGASVRTEEPRPPLPMNIGGMAPRPTVPQAPRPPAVSARIPQQMPASVASMTGISPQDQEKAALIMQVLQLSDQQIAMLPPEQRQSILILKEQVARSAH